MTDEEAANFVRECFNVGWMCCYDQVSDVSQEASIADFLTRLRPHLRAADDGEADDAA